MVKTNQNGLTIIEILATILILSFVTIITINIFSNGIRGSSSAKNSILLQQETNYLLAVLRENHENGDEYEIKVENYDQKVTITNKVTLESTVFSNKKLLYEIIDLKNNINAKDTITQKPLDNMHPENKRFEVKIKISLKDNPSIFYEINTTFSRL